MRIGVIGCGHWGPNHVRVFSQLKGVRVTGVADRDESRVRTVCEMFDGLHGYTDYRQLISQDSIDAVVVVTPTKTHFDIVTEALDAGKHVLCEKPLCLDPCEGEKLLALADSKRLVLMIGHVFLFNAGVRKVRELIDAGDIGAVRYLSAVRTNLGPVRSDVNAAYDLASHDISVFNWLLGAEPLEVRAMGAAFVQPGIEDVVVAALRYPNNVLASIHCSWLDPKKVRQLTVVGSRRMLTWDDLNLSNPVALYEKSIEANHEVTDYGDFLRLSMLDGDVRLPKVSIAEPLRVQNSAFVRAVCDGGPVESDGEFAMGVVRALARVKDELSRVSV